MKTKAFSFASPNLKNGETIQFPAGLDVIPASNLPENSVIKYWLNELPAEMKKDIQIESFFRNYGIPLTLNDVQTPETMLEKQIENFANAMAGQFAAGLELVKGNLEAENAVLRDFDSFLAELNRWFPQKFEKLDKKSTAQFLNLKKWFSGSGAK